LVGAARCLPTSLQVTKVAGQFGESGTKDGKPDQSTMRGDAFISADPEGKALVMVTNPWYKVWLLASSGTKLFLTLSKKSVVWRCLFYAAPQK
jgi:hypothetical protein